MRQDKAARLGKQALQVKAAQRVKAALPAQPVKAARLGKQALQVKAAQRVKAALPAQPVKAARLGKQALQARAARPARAEARQSFRSPTCAHLPTER